MRPIYLFSGLAGMQGPPLAALRALYQRPGNARYFTTAADAIAGVLDHVGEDAYRPALPGGIPLTAWLRGAAPAGWPALPEPDRCQHSSCRAPCPSPRSLAAPRA